MGKVLFFMVVFAALLLANPWCPVPRSIATLISPLEKSDYNNPDIRRNHKALKKLCLYRAVFHEGNQNWKMLLVFNHYKPHGAFWFLPHDNENTAFDSAVYAVRRYGGGFLAVDSGDRRYHAGQDPNRNFSDSHSKVPSCCYQKAPSPIYTRNVFRIINAFKKSGMPYLALHNNTNGGGVSILKSSKGVQSFLAYPLEQVIHGKGLKDEDSLVYIAGSHAKPPSRKINRLLHEGMHVKYERVNRANNDCSMSNYVVLGKHSERYYNIEAQHGDGRTQRKMIDKLMEHIMQ